MDTKEILMKNVMVMDDDNYISIRRGRPKYARVMW